MAFNFVEMTYNGWRPRAGRTTQIHRMVRSRDKKMPSHVIHDLLARSMEWLNLHELGEVSCVVSSCTDTPYKDLTWLILEFYHNSAGDY